MEKKFKLIMFGLIVIAALFLLLGFNQMNNNIVLIVNGEKISEEEYDFLTTCSINYLDHYTDETYDLDTRKVLLIRAEQILLKENGIMKDYSYDKFVEQLAKENEKRKEAIENNQVIYGPKQYDKKVYFDYYYSECRTYFKNTILSNSSEEDKNSEQLDKMYEERLLNKVKELKVTKIK